MTYLLTPAFDSPVVSCFLSCLQISFFFLVQVEETRINYETGERFQSWLASHVTERAGRAALGLLISSDERVVAKNLILMSTMSEVRNDEKRKKMVSALFTHSLSFPPFLSFLLLSILTYIHTPTYRSPPFVPFSLKFKFSPL